MPPPETVSARKTHSRRVERSAAQRTRILESALDLMTRHGYNATSMRDLAKEAGCTQANIYHYFENKEDVFQALLDDEGEKVARALSPDRYLKSDPLSNLQIFGDIFEELFEKNRAFFMLMAIDFVEFDGKHYRRFFTDSGVRAPELEGAYNRMQKDGLLRDLPFPVVVAAFIYPLYMYFTVEKLFGANKHLGLDDIDVLKQMREIFMLGIVRDPALRQHLEEGGDPPSLTAD